VEILRVVELVQLLVPHSENQLVTLLARLMDMTLVLMLDVLLVINSVVLMEM
jgi:hypothetical protein